MSDQEKVAWMRALLCIWGSLAVPLLLMGIEAAMFRSTAAAILAVLAAWGVATLGYLLVLSWRAAYLSGRAKR